MPTSTPPTDPDSLAVLHALSREELSAEDAYNAAEGIRNMAGHNVTAAIDAQNARFESKIDALAAQQDAKLTALDTKLRMLLWMVPVALAVIGILIRLWG